MDQYMMNTVILIDDCEDEYFISRIATRRSKINVKIIHFFGVADFMRTIEKWDTNTLTGPLVLFDLNLPCESGLDGIRHLRATNRLSGIVTGICSGSDDPGDRRRAAAGGADFFVGKPLDIAAWQEICRSVSDLDLVETAGGVFNLVRRPMKAA